MKNKSHWYDGWFYDKFIAPNQDKSYLQLESLIDKNSSILDVGCGTGRLAQQLEGKYSFYVGIDPSIKNIETCKTKYLLKSLPNISFYHFDVESYFSEFNISFEYAVISFVIHEVDEKKREQFLSSISRHTKHIIIIDYLFPKPNSFWSYVNSIVEFIAGKQHYLNYKSYLQNGGINGLVEKSNLKIVREIKNQPSTTHIALIEKETPSNS